MGRNGNGGRARDERFAAAANDAALADYTQRPGKLPSRTPALHRAANAL